LAGSLVIRRIGPWLTPALVAAEIALVLSGLLGVRTAVGVGLGIEALLWATAASRVLAGLRRFRAGRAAGLDAWQAAEDGLAAVLPRRMAKLILFEPRLWVCLARWATGRYPKTGFHYDASLRTIIWTAAALVVIEGAIVDLLLELLLPGGVWVWVALGLHLYGLLVLLGFLASWATHPHILDEHGLRLRDGIFTELVIPYSAVTDARVARQPNLGRSGLKIDGTTAVLACGDATVALALDSTRPLAVHGRPEGISLASLATTVDQPRTFVDALRARALVACTDARM
jgi:hypothetical protein